MAGIDDLNAAVATLQTDVSAENAEIASLVQGFQGVQAQLTTATNTIAQLQQELANGGTVTDAQLEAIATAVNSAAQSSAQAVAAAQQAIPPTPAPGS